MTRMQVVVEAVTVELVVWGVMDGFLLVITGGHGGTSFDILDRLRIIIAQADLFWVEAVEAVHQITLQELQVVVIASSGATGGGMVIINSSTIIGTGTINANGVYRNNTVLIDGSGGGGAGGSILIYANSGHAGITAIANGGNGAR